MNCLKLLNNNLDNLLKLLYTNKISIILTTCVNVNHNIDVLYQRDKQSRINTYVKSINKWINETNLNIIVVENSGYSFPQLQSKINNRFQIITFDSNKNIEFNKLKFQTSKGQWEMFAIQYAYKNSEMLQKSEFIIKITGRYYIPNFLNYLIQKNIMKYDCLIQYKIPNRIDRCEFVGCKKKLFNDIFNEIMPNGLAEAVFKERIKKYTNVLRCDKLEIEPTIRGGVCEIKTFL